MKYIILVLSISIFAQTQLKPPQLKVEIPPAGQIRLVALVGDSFRLVEVGPGLTLTTTATGLRIDGPAAVEKKLRPAVMSRASDGRYGPYVDGGLVVRNGVVQLIGADYTVDGAVLTPVGLWDKEDSVVLWSVKAAP